MIICSSNIGRVSIVSFDEGVEPELVKSYVVDVEFLGKSEKHQFNTVLLLSSFIGSIQPIIKIIMDSRKVERPPPR